MRRGLPSLVLLGALLVPAGLAVTASAPEVPPAPDPPLIAALARSEVAALLHQALDAANPRIEEARDNPLVDAAGVFLLEGGEQVLPRIRAEGPEATSHARAIYDAFLQGNVMLIEDGAAWSQRLALAMEVRGATYAENPTAVETTLRTVLAHRTRYPLPAVDDLPLTLALLELVAHRGPPDTSRLQTVLRDGYSEPGGGTVEGLEAALLRARDEFSKSDFSFLVERVEALADEAHVAHDDLDARLAEPPGATLGLAAVQEPTLFGEWYAEPAAEDSTRGVRVDLRAIGAHVRRQLEQSHVLRAEDPFALGEPPKTGLTLAALPISIQQPQRQEQVRQQHRTRRLGMGVTLFGALLSFAGALALLVRPR